MIIWHNNRCSKSRCAVELLDTKSIDYQIVEYLKNPPSEDEIKAVLEKLGMKASELIRKGEPIFKEEYKGKELSEAQWVTAMSKHPKLIERPIIIKGNKAVIGRPAENLLDLI